MSRLPAMIGILTQSQSFKNTKTHLTGRVFKISRFCKVFWGKRGSWASVGPTGRRLPDRRSCQIAPLRGFPLPTGSNRRRGPEKNVGFCSHHRPVRACQNSRPSGTGKVPYSCVLFAGLRKFRSYLLVALTYIGTFTICRGSSERIRLVGMKRGHRCHAGGPYRVVLKSPAPSSLPHFGLQCFPGTCSMAVE